MFSKNQEDKHKSLLSRHELSAVCSQQKKKKERNQKKKKSEILRQILSTLHMGQINLEFFT